MLALIDKYSKEELEQIVQSSFSLKEVIKKLGYSTTSGSNNKTVKERIKKYNIDISHFTSTQPIKRTESNVFVENSTASQKVLREWYKKGEYTIYECSICKLKPIWQGKELTLILDHINGQNNDNRLENLRWVCPNCNQQLDTTGGKNIKILAKKYYCIDCGKEITKASKRCFECDLKYKTIPIEEMPITRVELKNLIRTTPFTTIAMEYNVSDNAIQKWCDKLNLPRRKKDIVAFSEEEWEKL